MFSRKVVLDQQLNLNQTKINLPTRNIIDNIILTVTATYTNSDSTNAATLTNEQLLNAIQEVRVVSDGANVHYSLSMNDIAIMNYYDTSGKAINLDETNSIAASGSLTKVFTVKLDGGDIFAGGKQSLDLSIVVNPAVSSTVSLTDLNIKVGIGEIVLEDISEIEEIYGENLEFLVEPSITATEVNVSANTSFQGLVEIPAGNAILRSFYIAKDTNEVRSNSVIDQYGLVDRNSTIYYKMDFTMGQHLDEQEYNVPALTGAVILDYAEELGGSSEIFDEEFGLKAWNFVKGDYLDAFKLQNSGKIRIIRHELICGDGAKALADGEIEEEDVPEEFAIELEG
ncbi:hypothetical protein [Methanocaldococcus sp.]